MVIIRIPRLFLFFFVLFASILDVNSNQPPTEVHEQQLAYRRLIESYRNDTCIELWKTGEEMKNFLLNPAHSHKCIITLTGATWDGHFKRYLELGIFKRVAKLFCSNPVIILGLFFYQSDHLPQLRKNLKDQLSDFVWQQSDPSYAVHFFQRGSQFVDPNSLPEHQRRWLRQLKDFTDVSDEVIKNYVEDVCGLRKILKDNETVGEEL